MRRDLVTCRLLLMVRVELIPIVQTLPVVVAAVIQRRMKMLLMTMPMPRSLR